MALKDVYYTISEAAKELNVSRQTLYRWIADNKIQVEKIGGVTLIEKPKVVEYGVKKFYESAYQVMDSRCIDQIRKQYGYSNEDKIVRIEPEDDYLVYLVTRKNGRQEKIKIGDVEVAISVSREQGGVKVTDLKFKEVIKEEETPLGRSGRKTKRGVMQ